MLPDPITTVLCRDPTTTYRLNCNAFQQHGLTSEFGWQYAAFYTSDTPDAGAPRYVSLARRRLPDGDWQRIVLRDYAQVTEDGHNTISMGISRGDGRIHLVWDLHSDQLRYRRSEAGVAWSDDEGWSEGSFGVVESSLPGADDAFKGKEITYPRFLGVGDGEMLFEFRVGRAGSGDAALCKYEKGGVDGWRWRWLGVYLEGDDCSPYVNGLSLNEKRGTLWVSWTNRRFIEQQRECDQSQQSQQAGPNGPENNEDLGCIWSDDGGKSWRVNDGAVVAGSGAGTSSVNSRDGKTIVRWIPRDSGIMNSEGQCTGVDDGFHVLMRDDSAAGTNQWKHHRRNGKSTQWSTTEFVGLQPTGTGSRGKVCCDPSSGDIYFVIPGNTDLSLTLLKREYLQRNTNFAGTETRGEYGPIEIVWQQHGFNGEPLIDEERLRTADRRLSVMTRKTMGSEDEGAEVVVLDWDLTYS